MWSSHLVPPHMQLKMHFAFLTFILVGCVYPTFCTSAFECSMRPKPVRNYVCNAARCNTDVHHDNADPNGAFCCYCNKQQTCTKTAKYQHGAPLNGTTVSCELTSNRSGEGPAVKCVSDADCNLRWPCVNKLWLEGATMEEVNDEMPTYTFHESRWPHGLPDICQGK